MAVNFEALRKMTTDQLRELNGGVCQVIRERNAERAANQIRTFRRGDDATFRCSRTGRMIKCRVDKLNTKTIGVTEICADGSLSSRQWRVSPSLLSHVIA